MRRDRAWRSTIARASLASLGLGQFDLVTSMEVLEHVADKQAFVSQLAAHLAPGGLMVLSTPNRTPQSRLLLVGAAEAIGAIPKGTHHWEDFVTPDELRELLAERRPADGRAERHRLLADEGAAPVATTWRSTTSSPRRRPER